MTVSTALIVIICLLSLVSCHFCTHEERVHVTHDTNRYIYEFEYLDGEYETIIDVVKGSNIDIISEFEGGNPGLSIKRNDGICVFDERSIESTSFGIVTSTDGKYTFIVKGHKLKGKLEIIVLD